MPTAPRRVHAALAAALGVGCAWVPGTTPPVTSDDDTAGTSLTDDTDVDETDVQDETDADSDLQPSTCGLEPTAVSDPDPRTVVAGVADVDAFVADLTAFGLAAYRADAPSDVNTMLSPVSLAAFFAAAGLDAQGDTRQALDDALTPTTDLSAWTATLGTWLRDVPAPPAHRHALIQRGAALFYRRDHPPGDAWSTASALIDEEAFPRAFDDVDAVRAEINHYVEQHTACLIPELFGEGDIHAHTLQVLVDALAVIADWRAPFEPGATSPAPFHRADGTTVSAPTMRGPQRVGLGTVTVDGVGLITVLRLPLADPTLAVWIAMPEDAAHGLDALDAALDPGVLATLLGAVEDTHAALFLPRFAIDHRPDVMGTVVPAVGLATLTGPTADLGSLCAGCGGLALVVHQATFEADEQGIRAAAATGGTIDDSATPQLDEVHVDRPFLVLLRDEATGVPWFVGHVGDPTAP